jgi:hypothetical protein
MNCPLKLKSPKLFCFFVRLLFPDSLPFLDGKQTVTELQRECVAIAAGASEDEDFNYASTVSWNENDAVKYIARQMKMFLGDY